MQWYKAPVICGERSHSILRMSDSNPSTALTDEYHDMLRCRFPCAGYWLNMLPTHPFIHGPGIQPDTIGNTASLPLPFSPLDPTVQMSLSVQPCRFSVQTAPTGPHDEPNTLCYSGTLQLASFGPVSSGGQPNNAEGQQDLIYCYEMILTIVHLQIFRFLSLFRSILVLLEEWSVVFKYDSQSAQASKIFSHASVRRWTLIERKRNLATSTIQTRHAIHHTSFPMLINLRKHLNVVISF